eukprot:CAMPEP_0114245310 /NCGR_PEP_ID=MMETSP0058-20121206/11822_1 /TAXON_ID=36894 /ORGANISM="Pyramimonas parkeae, CCMP726" /LENGTH=103 /DNA_ID=CAMNT_0001358343 /DNA_START=380 /DNA_END=688 /DNA_ORIENTATION=+
MPKIQPVGHYLRLRPMAESEWRGRLAASSHPLRASARPRHLVPSLPRRAACGPRAVSPADGGQGAHRTAASVGSARQQGAEGRAMQTTASACGRASALQKPEW